jgi:hypothetical protein
MDAIIGRFKVRIEETGLILKHEVGVSFDLTIEETLGLFNFINAYRGTLNFIKDDQDPETQKLTRFVKNDDKKRTNKSDLQHPDA